MSSQYDLIIVGAGLVGASLACALAEQPMRIAVIDRHSVPVTPSQDSGFAARALALNYRSIQTFKRLGIWPEIAPIAEPINVVHVTEQKRFGRVRITAEQMGVEALGYVLPADQLLIVLQHRLRTLNHLDVFAQAELTDMVNQENQVTLTIADQKKSHTLTGALCVAADGQRSKTRELLAMNVTQQDTHSSAILAGIKLNQPHKHVAFERFTPLGPLAMLPLRDQCVKAVWVVPNECLPEKMALSPQDFLNDLQQQFGFYLGPFKQLLARASYPLTTTFTHPQALENLIFLGNSAHTFTPIAAQGFNLGLRDALTLVDLLIQQQATNKSKRDFNLIQHYLSRVKHYQPKIIGATDLLTRLFGSDFLPIQWGRNLGMQVVTLLPPLRRRLAKTFMGI